MIDRSPVGSSSVVVQMRNKFAPSLAAVLLALVFSQPVRADVPAPPVNQMIGMLDILHNNMTQADCRGCHTNGVSSIANRHHLLYGKPVPPGSHVPNPGPVYTCISCHGQSFTVIRDCVVCHTTNPHHTTAKATAGNCQACHGAIVDNRNDGHYIPAYVPTPLTPKPSRGYGLPLNSRRKGAGACDYCHDSDSLAVLPRPPIAKTSDLHHGGKFDCAWCHDMTFQQPAIRICEGCHGPGSLHSIQADSPAPGNVGTIVVGGEFTGYGHVGRDAGPRDSDCWGCHGTTMGAVPGAASVVPTLTGVSKATIFAGVRTSIVLAGAGFTTQSGNTAFEVYVILTGADGKSVNLTPDVIASQAMLAVTIPGNLPRGNYSLRVARSGFASNALVINIVPQVKITKAVAHGKTVTITGSGFGGFAKGSATGVTGTTAGGKVMKGVVVSWNDTKIVATFIAVPSKVTVQSVFGTATAKVTVP